MTNNNLCHLSLILDGNKRWAKKNKLNNINGYTKGFENIKNLVNFSLSENISYLTIFALSSENFKRSSINLIYEIIYKNFDRLINELARNKGVRIKIFGFRDNLPSKLINIFDKAENISKDNKSLNLNIAFNYGFKEEIKMALEKYKKNSLNYNIKNESDIKKLFFLSNSPDPDLLIRTGGHQRLSNFIMYNLTYTELFFTDTLWPDFNEVELKTIINKFKLIDRKYGL